MKNREYLDLVGRIWLRRKSLEYSLPSSRYFILETVFIFYLSQEVRFGGGSVPNYQTCIMFVIALVLLQEAAVQTEGNKHY